MIKALFLIFGPGRTWDRIVEARRAYGFLVICYLLPMVTLSCAGELAGLYEWGKMGAFGKITPLPENVLITYGLGQFVVSILMVLIGARIVRAVAESFHGRPTSTQALRLVVYSFSPLFLFRLLDACPVLNVWLAWGVGSVFCLSVLYSGLPRVLSPDPAHAFGLYLVSAILLVVVSGLARLVTWAVLGGKFVLPITLPHISATVFP